MYLRKIALKNIKCFANFQLDFTSGDKARKWTVLLGRNGLGKSTLLQAIGVALAGPSAMRELLPVAEGWVRRGEHYGEIEARLKWTDGDALVPGWPKTKTPYIARYIVTGENPKKLPDVLKEKEQYAVPTIVDWSGEGTSKERENITKDMNRLKQTAYAEGKSGWLGCGYGPFRRLSGGSQSADRILYAERKSARFITLFREDAALTNAKKWLITLYNTARDGDEESKRTLEHVKHAFAKDLLPKSAKLHVNARDALLEIGDQQPIPFHDLSDGYRSMLALGIDLLRWLIDAFPDEHNPMRCPGVVLIDELDAHVHPTWQRRIGHWLRQKFPNLQFIVATHSPFLAQVADPGGNVVLVQSSSGVKPRIDNESVETWRADQIYTELFDLPSTRSPESEDKLHQFQKLHLKRQTDGLSDSEEEEYEQLCLWQKKEIPPPIEDPDLRRDAQALEEAVERREDRLRDLS
jgi:energy-coupling factor transporter ATP-binding protein EcfA2